MFARKLLTGIAAGAVAATVVATTAGTAFAYTPDGEDATVAAPIGADLFGVGSDTSQGLLKVLGDNYNAQSPVPGSRIVSYAATGGGTVPLPTGTDGNGPVADTVTRPVGSSQGLNALHAGGNIPGVDFARSSRAIKDTEISDGLQMFPFAKDQVVTAVQNPGSYSPGALSGAQLLSIYRCDAGAANWQAFGGTNTAIVPLLPATGGTRDFFLAQLASFNGGNAFNPGACVKTTQADGTTPIIEHDPAPITERDGTIAPFSVAKSQGKAGIRLLGGFLGERALYNVVRPNDANKAEFQAVFGVNGYLCSAAGKTAIEAQGFKQLLPVNKGGVCGQQTQSPTTNLATEQVATSTAVTVSSASASAARVVARITSAAGTPSGTVTFFEGTTTVASNVPLASGAATATPAAAPGTHTYRAVFTPAANTAFFGSEGTGTGVVSAAKSAARITESFPSKAKVKTKRAKNGKIFFVVKPAKGSISITGGTARPTGTILVKKGSKTVGSGSLVNGVAGLRINGLKIGKNTLTVTYGGDAATNSGVLSFTIKAVKPGGKKKK